MRRIASWETTWMTLVSFVIVLWMLSLTVCGYTLGISSNSDPALPPAQSCPDPEVIAPCICSFNATLGMDMDCSNVTSEDELRRVFSNEFAFSDFRKFTITDNHSITSLREGDLGSVSFQEIHIENTSLSEIEDDALKGSFHTLVTLDIKDSRLKSVPDISAFTGLEDLTLGGNLITMFPNESSETLLSLYLNDNQIDDVPEEAIITLTSLENLSLYGNSLTEIHPNAFTRNEHLNYLNLGSNMLTTFPADVITLHGQYTYLFMPYNQITSLTYESFSGVNGFFGVYGNDLTEVPEKVFRPLLEDQVMVDMDLNPFKCGCDMAWLVLNQTLLKRLVGTADPQCPDLEYFSGLDPEVYKVMCPNATAVPL